MRILVAVVLFVLITGTAPHDAPVLKNVASRTKVQAVAEQTPKVEAPAPVVEPPAPPQTAPTPELAPAETPVPTPEPTTHEGLMAAAGISQSDWPAVEYIVSHESGWCPFQHEGGIGCPDSPNWLDGHAYGLCQALPGTKMSSAGDDWLTNPVTQLKWCSQYALGSYGGWWGAYNAWVNQHWW